MRNAEREGQRRRSKGILLRAGRFYLRYAVVGKAGLRLGSGARRLAMSAVLVSEAV